MGVERGLKLVELHSEGATPKHLFRLVTDVVVITSSCHTEQSCECHFAYAKPRFCEQRSILMVVKPGLFGTANPLLPVSRRAQNVSLKSLMMKLLGVSAAEMIKKKERWRLLTKSQM